MKKILLILILAAYTVSVSGTGVAFHFCMGKFAGTSFWQYAEKHDTGCGICGMKEKESSCCKDRQAYLKLTTDHQAVSHFYTNVPQGYAILPLFHAYVNTPVEKTHAKLFPLSNAPPKAGGTSLHVLNCVFLI